MGIDWLERLKLPIRTLEFLVSFSAFFNFFSYRRLYSSVRSSVSYLRTVVVTGYHSWHFIPEDSQGDGISSDV